MASAMSQWRWTHPDTWIGESVIWAKPDGGWELRVIEKIYFDDSPYPNVRFQESLSRPQPQGFIKKLKSLFNNKSFKGTRLDKIYPLIDLERGHCWDLSRSYKTIGEQFNHGRDVYAEVLIADLATGDQVIWFPGGRVRNLGVLNVGKVIRIGTRSDVHHNRIFMAEVEFEDFEIDDFQPNKYRNNSNGNLRCWDFVNVSELWKLGEGIEVLLNEYSTGLEAAGLSKQAATSGEFTNKPEPLQPGFVSKRIEIFESEGKRARTERNPEFTFKDTMPNILQSKGYIPWFSETPKSNPRPGTSKMNVWDHIKNYSESIEGWTSMNDSKSSVRQRNQSTNASDEGRRSEVYYPNPNKHEFEQSKPKFRGMDTIPVPNRNFEYDEKLSEKYKPSSSSVSGDYRDRNFNLLLTSDGNRGTYGIQGNRNSCYLDASIFALFSFSRTFDALLAIETPDWTKSQKDRSEPPTSIRNILTEIVSELRGNFYVPLTSIRKLRAALALNDPRFLSECMDAEEFLLTMFKHLDVPDFFQFDNGAADQIHQLVVPVEQGTVLIKEVKTLIKDSFWYSEVELTDKPHPALILKLPFCDGMPLFGSKYVVPNLRIRLLDLGIKNREETEAMDLMAIICLRSSHYVCYAKTREGEMAPWVYFDSNPVQERPQVQLLLGLGLDLLKAQEHPRIFETNKNPEIRFEYPEHMRLISSFAYICIYVPC